MKANRSLRDRLVCGVVALFLGLSCGASPGAALDLDLAPVELPGGTRADFTKSSCEAVDALPFAEDDENVNQLHLPHHDLYFRIDDIVPKKSFGFVRYRFFVKRKSGAKTGVLECTVHATPSGSFRPQLADVSLYLGESGEAKESATIRLPILCLTPQAYLTAPAWKEPEVVEIGGETELSVPLHNLLREWPVRVEAVSQPSRKNVWREATFLTKGQPTFTPFDVPVDVNDDRLTLKLAPNSGRALLKALFSRSSQGDPERITATVEYSAQLGLKAKLDREVLPIDIPVRFVPWPPLLLLSLAAGTLFGSLVPLLTGQRKRADWLHAFGASVVSAILAELIGMFLVQHDSELRLLGFSLDPFQLLPSALIGVLLGLLGFKSVEIVKRLIPGHGKDASPEKET